LAKAKSKAAGVYVLNNNKQLGLGWTMLADDNDGQLPGNLDGGNVSMLANSNKTWVLGWLDFSGNPANTNTLYLTHYSPLAPYIGRSAAVFKNPADKSRSRGRTGPPRVRSISMNGYLGLNRAYTANYAMMTKVVDIRRPAETWVFVEEREDSINDGWFAVDMIGYDPRQPGQWRIVDFPAVYNNGATAFAFADGHAEFKKWVDPRTRPSLKFGQPLGLNVSTPNNRDVEWLQHRSTYKNSGTITRTD
jgi:prepilin-type processing-associated H-X9-DG protein